jgi:hypothetical protein
MDFPQDSKIVVESDQLGVYKNLVRGAESLALSRKPVPALLPVHIAAG